MTTKQANNDLTLSFEASPEMAPEGRHPILCVDVFETWPEEETWDGKTKTYRKIMFVFQVFPDIAVYGEDGSRDSYGDIFRVEYKVNFSFAPAGPNTSASRLWTFSESWLGKSFSTKSAKFNPTDMIGKAAWGTLEQKTRWTQIMNIEPYVDDDGKALPAPKPEPYKRRTYPNPATWKDKEARGAASQPVSSRNDLDPIPSEHDLDQIPF